MPLTQLTIVGAGLIGGSIALRARQNGLASKICAIDRQPAPAGTSPFGQLFDHWIEGDQSEEVKQCLQASALTVLCIPVSAIIQILPSVLKWSLGPVTDCGSTKETIVRSVSAYQERARFVPGHPMAGHPRGGIENATSDLFVDKKWILCSGQSSQESAEFVRDFVRSLGAIPLDLSPEDHDRSVAITSHLPQVIASALSVLAQKNDALKAAGPGFASATRVAGGHEEMWKDIFETNGAAIADALQQASTLLGELSAQLGADKIEGVLQLLRGARNGRRSDDEGGSD